MPPITSDDNERAEPTQTQLLKDRRFKLSRACDRCRRRRIKCDEGHPCQPCTNASSACTFEEAGKKSHPHKSKRTSTLEERMAQLEQMIQSIPANIFYPPQPSQPTQSAQNGQNIAESQPNPVTPTAAVPPQFPSLGVPPPSLSHSKLMNPGTHFIPAAPQQLLGQSPVTIDGVTSNFRDLHLAPTFLYLDDEGSTRWQGDSSGLPLLDLLVERHVPQMRGRPDRPSSVPNPSSGQHADSEPKWFPDRQTRKRVQVNPETLWKTVTSAIPPDLMDHLVQTYLSTTYYLLPFLHVPTFLHDYSNPTKWGEPGFACFIIAVCCLASRHSDDPRVRSDPSDPFSSGTDWFDLYGRLRNLPSSDQPTLYTVQSIFIAAIYAIGLGRLSKGFALLAEAITLSFDAGIHRSVEAYDCFDTIENEVRRRTFWSIYMWDKQVGATFGRPPLVRLRDCDVPEPSPVDDEYITSTGITTPPPGSPPARMTAFIAALRLFVVLESVMDTPPPTSRFMNNTPFMARATTTLTGFARNPSLIQEESLLDEVCAGIPVHWQVNQSPDNHDVIQMTQSQRLRCLEQWIRMLIHRHRLSSLLTSTEASINNEDNEIQEMIACQQAAINIIHSQLQMATHGLMGFFGVAVIHQLNQAGRTLVAILLNCKSHITQSLLVEPGLEALRSCLVLLRRFSVRYLCGLRSADLIEEFCRVPGLPIGAPAVANQHSPRSRRAWLRPVRRRKTPHSSISLNGGTTNGNGTSPSEDQSEPSPPQYQQPSVQTDPVNGVSVHDIFDLNAAGVSPSPLPGPNVGAVSSSGLEGVFGLSHYHSAHSHSHSTPQSQVFGFGAGSNDFGSNGINGVTASTGGFLFNGTGSTPTSTGATSAMNGTLKSPISPITLNHTGSSSNHSTSATAADAAFYALLNGGSDGFGLDMGGLGGLGTNYGSSMGVGVGVGVGGDFLSGLGGMSGIGVGGNSSGDGSKKSPA